MFYWMFTIIIYVFYKLKHLINRLLEKDLLEGFTTLFLSLSFCGCLSVFVCVYVFLCVSLLMYLCVSLCLCVSLYLCVYVFVCVCVCENVCWSISIPNPPYVWNNIQIFLLHMRGLVFGRPSLPLHCLSIRTIFYHIKFLEVWGTPSLSY